MAHELQFIESALQQQAYQAAERIFQTDETRYFVNSLNTLLHHYMMTAKPDKATKSDVLRHVGALQEFFAEAGEVFHAMPFLLHRQAA